jgi:hypothetical protein
MSEFQYYEFQAIDHPLDEEAQRALRRMSTRARITPHSLVNTYQWGDFKGDPRELVARWFDLFVYWANWGSRRTLMRLPRRSVDLAAVRRCRVRGILEFDVSRDHVIVDVQRTIEDSADELPEEAGASVPFAALRADLLRGDESCFYLGWLLGVQDGLISPEATEPSRPPGLSQPSGALHGFAAFFGLDGDLLAAAAEEKDGDGAALPEPAPGDMKRFIARLPEAERTDLLCRSVLGNAPSVTAEIRRRWLAAEAGSQQAEKLGQRRTAHDLLSEARDHARERRRRHAEREAAERAERAERDRIERERRLSGLVGREAEAWGEVEAIAEEKRSAEYDQAAAVLKDLQALAERDGRTTDFASRLERFRAGHRRKLGLLDRLRSAGL